jgi:hypothetical protein
MKRAFKAFDWECSTDGCFNKLKRLKFGVLFDCFPGAISFSDVDGIVEIAGNALLLEWKPTPSVLSPGQRIMYQRITVGRRFSVMIVAGDASTMEATHRAGFVDGRWRDWKPATLDDVKSAIKGWTAWATAHPRLGG